MDKKVYSDYDTAVHQEPLLPAANYLDLAMQRMEVVHTHAVTLGGILAKTKIEQLTQVHNLFDWRLPALEWLKRELERQNYHSIDLPNLDLMNSPIHANDEVILVIPRRCVLQEDSWGDAVDIGYACHGKVRTNSFLRQPINLASGPCVPQSQQLLTMGLAVAREFISPSTTAVNGRFSSLTSRHVTVNFQRDTLMYLKYPPLVKEI